MHNFRRHLTAFGALLATSIILTLPAVRLELSRSLTPQPSEEGWNLTRCGVTETTSGHFEISADEQCVSPAVGCHLPLATTWTHLRIASSIEVAGTARGEHPWSRPLVSLTWMNESLEIVDYSVLLFRGALGTVDLGRQSEIFNIPRNASSVVVRFVNAAASGTMHAHAISITSLRGRPGIAVAQLFVLVLWGAVFVVSGHAILGSCRRRWLRPVVAAIAVAIVIGALAPRHELPWAASERPRSTAQAESPSVSPAPLPNNHTTTAGSFMDRAAALRTSRGRIAKAGHLLAFLILAGALLAARPRGGWPSSATALVAFAAATEVLQGFTPSRNPTLNDFLLDLAGITIAIAAVALVSRLHRVLTRGGNEQPA